LGFTEATRRIAERLSRSFAFGSYTYEDISQQIYLSALEALPFYDGQRSLENFLYRTCTNQLINLKRNKFWRAEPACKLCAKGALCEPGGCAKHTRWLRINSSKASLANCGGQVINQDSHTHNHDGINDNELYNLIGLALPANLREPYLRLKDGVSVGETDLIVLKEALAYLEGVTDVS
jgi:hypothetical protein